MIALLISAAFADFYHPDAIAAESKRFAEAAERAGAVFEDRQRDAQVLAKALRTYELGLDLLGERAPAEERARLDAAWKEYNREFAVLDAFATTMMEDFDAVFRGALDRALTKHAGAVQCEAELATGPRMPGLRGPTKQNPDCVGNDINGALTRAIDADAALAKAVEEIVGLRWPEVALDGAAQAPIGAGDRSVSVAAFVREVRPLALRAIAERDLDARDEFEAAIEQGATKADLVALLTKSEALEAQTASDRAEVAAPVLAAAQKTFAKWTKKGAPTTVWCANPPDLGGCTVPDATKELLPSLVADKKIAKLAE